jgi:hypothetical protein
MRREEGGIFLRMEKKLMNTREDYVVEYNNKQRRKKEI